MSITLTGRVQGVGFRFFVEEAAQALGLTGWVRNGWDGGTVEVEALGDPGTLEELCHRLREGPPLAHVTGSRIIEIPEQDGETGFVVRY